jgi:hypothetical protein
MIDASKLPQDPAALQALLLAEIARRERAEERAAVEAERATADKTIQRDFSRRSRPEGLPRSPFR